MTTPDVQAQLLVAINNLSSQVGAMQRAMSTFGRTVSYQQTQSLVSVGAGNVAKPIGGPLDGVWWEIRRISFGPPSGGVLNSSGTLIIFRGSQDPSRSGGGVELTRSTLVPNDTEYQAGQIVIRNPDSIWAQWSGGTAGDVLVVDMQVVEWPISLPSPQ